MLDASAREVERARLQNLYEIYNPSNVASVDSVLSAYFPKHMNTLWDRVRDKYGEAAGQLRGDYTNWDASAVHEAANDNDSDYVTRLIRFYSKYNPDKLSLVHDTLQKFAGREREMFMALVSKYGPEPPPPSTAAAAVPAPTHPGVLRSVNGGRRKHELEPPS